MSTAEEVHLSSPEDENHARCGVDITGERWVEAWEPITCDACLATVTDDEWARAAEEWDHDGDEPFDDAAASTG